VVPNRRIERLQTLAARLSAAIAVLAATAPPLLAQQSPPPLNPREDYTRSAFYIPMRDGVRLYTVIFAPKDASRRYPILMERTPYDVGPYNADATLASQGAPTDMAREGYIFVFQDVRGRYMSEGTFEDVRPETSARRSPTDVDESTDAYDTIDWLVKCVPNNNGRVGVWGISYPGFYAGAAGIHSHPALKAISPEAPVSDWFLGDDFHHNGALFLMDFAGFYSHFGEPRPDNRPLTHYPHTLSLSIGDAYAGYLKLGPLPNLNAKHWHGRVRFWEEASAHPDYDAWWKARSLPLHLKDVRCAVLTVGGWYDAEDFFGPFADAAAILRSNPETTNCLVIGPWPHGGWSYGDFDRFGDETFGQRTGTWYRDNIFKPFFDYFLKGQGSWKTPRATVFATGANLWWQFPTWPPPNIQPVAFSLSSGRKLKKLAPGPAAESGYEKYASDPAKPVPFESLEHPGRGHAYMNADQRFAARRPDVLTWQTPPLDRDLAIAGPVRIALDVSTTGSDADYVVKLIDVLPPDAAPSAADPASTGYERLVSADVMRARYRSGFDRPAPLVPNRKQRVGFSLRNTCHVFLKGHRVMVQVQSSWFPLVDRNPQTFVNIYQAQQRDFRAAEERIYHSSQIVFPVLTTPPAPVPVETRYLKAPSAP
jgi:putative CocE/NonD family hydrolase